MRYVQLMGGYVGIVVELMEFCPKVVAAVAFDAGLHAFFGDGSEEMCDAIVCWC